MRYADMRRIGRRGTHEVAPKTHRHIPVVTGDYRLDAEIARRSNLDLPTRLANAIANAGRLGRFISR